MDSLLNSIGYSLAFSGILVKMGRVYYIFNNPSLSKKVLQLILPWLLIWPHYMYVAVHLYSHR